MANKNKVFYIIGSDIEDAIENSVMYTGLRDAKQDVNEGEQLYKCVGVSVMTAVEPAYKEVPLS